MRPEAPQLAALSAVIARDIEAIERLGVELIQLETALNSPRAPFRDAAAAGYVLHNIYCALENIFDQISRTFENHVTDPARWHRELLSKMFLEIPTIRPAVLPVELRGFLNDLRGFRHVFRHAYEFELDAEKVKVLAGNWSKARTPLLSALARYRDSLISNLA